MLQDQVLSHPARVLSEDQRAQFFEQGYLVLPDFVPAEWLQRLRQAQAELLERSRALTQSDKVFVLEAGHAADRPRLHRINSPQDQHPAIWDFFTAPLLTDLVADVVGPDVKFHHAKFNVKSEQGTKSFKWHQDIQGWPHTDYSPVTLGIYVEGCTAEQGPLTLVPGSNKGPLYSMYKGETFVAHIADEELDWIKPEMTVAPTGGPGTTLLLNCRTIHGSGVNSSNRPRPLLLPVYSSADSFPYTVNPIPSGRSGDIVRGKSARFASFDTRPCEAPPDFRAGYNPPWAAQSGKGSAVEKAGATLDY